MTWLKNRLKERSTWLGIITLASIAGFKLEPEQQEMIVTIGSTLAALVMTFTADKKPEPPAADWRAPDAVQKQIITTPEIDPAEGIKG